MFWKAKGEPMADIKEFAGYRYNPLKCKDISSVIAASYSDMTDDERDKFYERSEYNIVRVSNGKKEETDNSENNRYTRAGKYLRDWIKEGVLLKEPKEVMYLYEQDSIYKDTIFVNHGIVALLRLEELTDDSTVKI